MAYFNKFTGTKGWISTWERVIRFRYMIQEVAKKRTKILSFWQKYGDSATKEAFEVSRPTLFRWQKELKKGGGKLEALNKKSTAPKKRRRRLIPQEVEDFILKERQYDSHLSKDKLAVLLKQDGIATLSSSTVGRMLTDLKQQRKLKTVSPKPKPQALKKKLRSKGHTGSLVKADTVVRFKDGIKRYILTAIDVESKFAFAYAYKNHSSSGATDFMRKFKDVAPVSLTHVQTDNGSEFAKHFDIYLEKNDIVHFHTYPRSPKQNSEVERFNRTLSDAFISRNRSLLAHDIERFNKELMEWLLWYNSRRPHWSLGLVSPLRYICNQLEVKESQMWWTGTSA